MQKFWKIFKEITPLSITWYEFVKKTLPFWEWLLNYRRSRTSKKNKQKSVSYYWKGALYYITKRLKPQIIMKMCYKRTFSMNACINWVVHAAKHGTHNALRNTESNKHAHKFDLSLCEFGMTAKKLNFWELKILSECYHDKQEKKKGNKKT